MLSSGELARNPKPTWRPKRTLNKTIEVGFFKGSTFDLYGSII